MRRIIIAALLVGVVAGAGVPANAAVNLVVAGPGGAGAEYVTNSVTVITAAPAYFLNADALAPHDVVSVARKNNRPVFSSRIAMVTDGPVPIVGIESLEVGEYEFYCSLHPATMTGTLAVTA